jgi:hypothetical protein
LGHKSNAGRGLMFEGDKLKQHLEKLSAIKAEPFVVAEWNMNTADNILKIGNYRYRPFDTTIPKYQTLTNTFDEYDEAYFYTGATDADITIDGGFDSQDIPAIFQSKKIKEELLFSLEDCFNKFRPRSGINKVRFLDNGQQFVNFANPEMARQPRYYPGTKDDIFKYWTSYRTETIYKYTFPNSISFGASPQYINIEGKRVDAEPVHTFERGISNRPSEARSVHFIEDAAPFVVYKEKMAVNRIVIKMQTGVGDINLGPFANESETFQDPFFGNTNKIAPVKWRVQYLQDNSWVSAIEFDQNSIRRNGSPIIGPDGYLELEYGLIIPEQYRDSFRLLGEFSSFRYLPDNAKDGDAYLIRSNNTDIGQIRMWSGAFNNYISIAPRYGWQVSDESISTGTNFVTNLTNPSSFVNRVDKKIAYREFQEILGLRLVIETMSRPDVTFDLIELSPRLAANLTDRIISYNIQKTASDLGVAGLPVSQLLASVGTVEIFNFDEAFNENNNNSIIKNHNNKNIQFKFFEKIIDVENVVINNRTIQSYDYYVPIKTMYSEGFPTVRSTQHEISLELRDLYFYFESITAPELLIPNASLSYVVSLLMDYIGFTNYIIKRLPNEQDQIIPYFFVEPEVSVAEILNALATSTQSSMFFDEYNNFVVASKNFMMPSEDEREIDITLYGSKDFKSEGAVKNKSTNDVLANIIDVSFQDTQVFNDGEIIYTQRSIQRDVPTIREYEALDQRDKTWSYKSSLLWEVAGETEPISINNEIGSQSDYALTAVPLNTDLSADPPSVVNFKVVNNVIDLGEAISSFLLPRYNGFFYANGEMIRYDAVQFNIPGLSAREPNNPNIIENNVWISSTEEYQNYFAKVPFNGKIYPTGLVRIYSEPIFETVDNVTRLRNGPVAKHGRGQFGTTIVAHNAGISSYWSSNENVRGCSMASDLLFNNINEIYPEIAIGPSGRGSLDSSNITARQSSRNGIIRNFLSSSFKTETEVNKLYATQTGTVQASALVFNGPPESTNYTPIDLLSYVHKPLNDKYRHFGTRLRIIGRMSGSENRDQTADGSMAYYGFNGVNPDDELFLTGGSGGLGVLLNPETNNGYYFEILALSQDNNQESSDNIIFYKIAQDLRSGNIASGGTSITITGLANTVGLKLNQEVIKVSGEGAFGNNARITGISTNSITVSTTTSSTGGSISFTTRSAVPIKLWGGSSSILVDDGQWVGQYRRVAEENPTVYDLAVEYQDIGPVRRFFLYLDNQLLAIAEDVNPLPIYNSMALFVRGTSRVMFENVYALGPNYSQNTVSALETPANSIFGTGSITADKAFNKYAISGMINSLYLTGISPSEPPKYNIYFEEFGTIMREAAYFKVKYDKAYPTLYAKLAPTLNRIKGYSVSGFEAGAYGAEFIIFNATDTILNLDSAGPNYLTIIGVAFTNQSANELTMDDYFLNMSDFSKPKFVDSSRVISPIDYKSKYQEIKFARSAFGRNEFSLDAIYIQNEDDANNLMEWLVSKVTKPRKSVGLEIFPMPIIQLGDIVNIDYKDELGTDIVSPSSKKFVVYNIEYSRSEEGPSMNVYLSEVN